MRRREKIATGGGAKQRGGPRPQLRMTSALLSMPPESRRYPWQLVQLGTANIYQKSISIAGVVESLKILPLKAGPRLEVRLARHSNSAEVSTGRLATGPAISSKCCNFIRQTFPPNSPRFSSVVAGRSNERLPLDARPMCEARLGSMSEPARSCWGRLRRASTTCCMLLQLESAKIRILALYFLFMRRREDFATSCAAKVRGGA